MQVIAARRRLRFTGPEIAPTLGLAVWTVSGVLARPGMGKLGGIGAQRWPTVGGARRQGRHRGRVSQARRRRYRGHGMTIKRVLTGNGSGCRCAIHAIACRVLGIRHLRSRAYRLRTNRGSKRFIRTVLACWAYGAIYRTSRKGAVALRRLALALPPSTATLSSRPPTAHRSLQRANRRPRYLHSGSVQKLGEPGWRVGSGGATLPPGSDRCVTRATIHVKPVLADARFTRCGEIVMSETDVSLDELGPVDYVVVEFPARREQFHGRDGRGAAGVG